MSWLMVFCFVLLINVIVFVTVFFANNTNETTQEKLVLLQENAFLPNHKSADFLLAVFIPLQFIVLFLWKSEGD